MNVLLLVVDSLRASALGQSTDGAPCTPFMDRFGRESVCFLRAQASECWTLPAHMSMFTGLLPSEHGAHFRSMAYRGTAPTIAEHFARRGYATEVITRNSLFDGTIPGATRGFHTLSRPLGRLGMSDLPLALIVALNKPRVRRLIRQSGFFNRVQRAEPGFVRRLARMIVPADAQALGMTLERLTAHRCAARPCFLFVNLYDVHAPYPPEPDSPLRRIRNLEALIENLLLPRLATQLGSHAYLRSTRAISPRGGAILRRRYRRAVELMDQKLAAFFAAADAARLLDDTVVVVASDHGEAFGEHDLYFHDASVYQTHLHVPLWIRHPRLPPRVVDEVVETRQLFQLLGRLAEDGGLAGTMLDPAACAGGQIALAEHVHYPHVPDARPELAQDLAASLLGPHKAILRREGLFAGRVDADPDEGQLAPTSIADYLAAARRDGVPAASCDRAAAHLASWQVSHANLR